MAARPRKMVQVGPLELRPDAHLALADGRPVALTPRELSLLIALVRSEGAVVSREELSRAAWGRSLGPGDRSVDVYVRRLRSKLARALPGWRFIHTHVAFGYRFAAELPRSQSFHNEVTSA